MLREMFQAKIHHATVTECRLGYQGSLTVDIELIERAGMLVHQKIQVLNINNGYRLETYLIPGERGKREIIINGAAARHAQVGDQVIVITGKNKGQKGEIVRVAGDKVVVTNINLIKRHTKPNPQANQPGGIIEREAPIHISNVMVFNPAAGKGDRVGIKVLEDGRKLRVFRSSGEAIDA